MANFDKCRLCLRNDSKLIDLYRNKSKTNILKKHFWFLILKNDEQICELCWAKTLDFHSFYTNVEYIQKQLYFNIKYKEDNSENNDIKLDIDDDSPNNNENVDEAKSSNHSNVADHTNHSIIDSKWETCDKVCLDKGKLKRPYQCEKCTRNFMTDSQLNKHLSAKHSQTAKKIPNNKLNLSSDKTKKSKSTYVKSSNKRDYSNPEIDEKVRLYFNMKCELCDIDLSAFRIAKRHYRIKHEQDGYIVCCGKKFFQRHRVIDHTLQHMSPNNFYKCEPCGKEFTDRRTLKYHMETHIPLHLRPFQCTKCSKRFILQYDLTRHTRITHYTEEDKKFPCTHCEKLFVSKSICDAHIRLVHQFVYSQICDICARVFKTKQQLNHHHVSVHTNTPKVQCDICGVWLKNYLCLPQHMRRHKPDPFECPICHKVFRNKDVYKDHKRSAHTVKKLIPCMLCEKEFKSEGRLREHMTLHTGQNLYTCEYCSLGFKRNSTRHRHRKKEHYEEWLRDRKPPHTTGQLKTDVNIDETK